ncbi:MAG TPA: HAD domain-containing protein [Solirubrobacteraceae bacterium]|nr:HAD domain-containing protein [Solirubrobacteraceae bacterium]
MQAKERLAGGKERARPLLMVDIDGVISLFGGWPQGGWQRAGWEHDGAGARSAEAAAGAIAGSLHWIDGMPHFLSSTAAAHLLALSSLFELVWASGWEERADEHLPRLLGLPAGLPFLRFERAVSRANAHWKLEAIDAYAGDRPLAWVDDALGDACHAWATARTAPTLLVQTEPRRGLTEAEAARLAAWARALAAT